MTHASFSIESRQHDDGLVLHLTGELDLAAREQILHESESYLGEQPVVLDLSEAQFIDASVVGALFRLARLSQDRGGRIALVDARAEGRPIWQLTGYAQVCPVYVSVQEATSALAG
jgi:anti-sigma B factor antagonist